MQSLQHTEEKTSYKLTIPLNSLTPSTSNFNNLIHFIFLLFNQFKNLLNVQKRTAEVVKILYKK